MFNDAATELANLVDGAQSLSLTWRGVEHEFILTRHDEYSAAYDCEELHLSVSAHVMVDSQVLGWFVSFDTPNFNERGRNCAAPTVSAYCRNGGLQYSASEALEGLQRRIDMIRETVAMLP